MNDVEVKYRNMILQVFLFIITLGIYSIYWFYVTAKEMKYLARDPNAEPTLWTILLFVPLANIYASYKYCELFEKISTEQLNRWILFILWVVFAPAVWFIVQKELNTKATINQPGQVGTSAP